jgi:hypothetical protein
MYEHQIASTNTIIRIGASKVHVASPNICIVTYVGVLDVEIIERMNKVLMEVAGGFHPFYLMVDLSRTGTVTRLGRRHGAGGMLALNPAATAVIGASFHMRVVVEMITKGAKLLNSGLDGPVAFFANEMDGRTWITRLQKQSRVWQ